MSAKKFGLGKGLDALIPNDIKDVQDISNDKVSNNSVENISMNLIKANENQPRKNFDEDKILELSKSIKEYGVIQPVVVKKEGDFFTIIAGERRWRATKLLGLKEIPCIVMDITDSKVLEVSLVENIQRQDLNPVEEALAYKRLIENCNLTQEELSYKVGKSRTAITNSLRLLKLDSRVQEYLVDGIISEGHGRALLSLKDFEIQYKMAQRIIDEDLSVRDTEKIIRKMMEQANTSKSKNKPSENPYFIDIKDKLQNYFGTKVTLNAKKNKGKIQIEYYSDEELQRILELLDIN